MKKAIMRSKSLPIDEVKGWAKNPRKINEERLNKLKTQLREEGQFKPLVAVMEKGKAIILGGNMRLKAMRELLDEGHEVFQEIWLSIVEAPDDDTKLKIALIDNALAGESDDDKLYSLIADSDFDWSSYEIATGYPVKLDTFLERYEMADVRATGEAMINEAGGPEVIDRNVIAENKVKYDNATIKQIVLYYGLTEYETIVPMLEELAEALGLQNNTEVISHLIRQEYENHK